MHSTISVYLFYQLTREQPASNKLCYLFHRRKKKNPKTAKTFVATKIIREEQTLGEPPSSLHGNANNAARLFILCSTPWPSSPSAPTPGHGAPQTHSRTELLGFRNLKGHLKWLDVEKHHLKAGGAGAHGNTGAAAGSSHALRCICKKGHNFLTQRRKMGIQRGTYSPHGSFASISALFMKGFYGTTNAQLALCSQGRYFFEIGEKAHLTRVSLHLAADSSPS